MKKENLQILGLIFIFGIIIFLILSFGIKKNDVDFCRDIFKGLIEGRESVQKFIDWGNLKAIGIDVGATYSKLPNAKEKADYRKSFIKSLSQGFNNAGGRFKAFSNWRVYKQDGADTLIAADYKDKAKTILFTLSGYEKRKLTAIQWESTGG